MTSPYIPYTSFDSSFYRIWDQPNTKYLTADQVVHLLLDKDAEIEKLRAELAGLKAGGGAL